jgi:hypothetical protein
MERARASSIISCALAVLAACNGAGDAAPAPPSPAGPSDAAAPDALAATVVFVPDAMITLAPGEVRDLSVQVQPAGVHRVRFSLTGESLDASLDADVRDTDPSGNASVRLVAPRSASVFRVRATADEGPFAEAVVSVSGDGFASVLVTPDYAGVRAPTLWTASAMVRSRCADVKGIPPSDGPIVASSPPPAPVRLDALPVGPSIAVTLRWGQSVGGCADVARLENGESRPVAVRVADRPVELAATDVFSEHKFSPDGSVIEPLLASCVADTLEAFSPTGKSEAQGLLDVMQLHAPDSKAFEAARADGAWDAATEAYWKSSKVALRATVASWADKGLAPIRGGAAWTGRLRAGPSAPGHATLTVETLGGLPAARVGVAADNVVSLSADPGDTVHVGGTLLFFPSQLVAAAADKGAAPATASDALVALLDCPKLVDALVASGSAPVSCPTWCLRSGCENGLRSMWTAAAGSSAGAYALSKLSFTVSALARVDEEALIDSFSGTWVGVFARQTDQVSVKGVVSATAK